MFDRYFNEDRELLEGGKLPLGKGTLESVKPKCREGIYEWVSKNLDRCYEISHLYGDLHYKYGCLRLCLVWDNVDLGFEMVPGIESCDSEILTCIANGREVDYLNSLPKDKWVAVDMSHVNGDSVCFSSKNHPRKVWGCSILEDSLVSQILGKKVEKIIPEARYYLYRVGNGIKVVKSKA